MYRAGERPALQEYIDRHPELADDIREFFPAMAEIEQVKEDREEATERPPPRPSAAARSRLGDYRILREIGRGGMGVVYEAEQVSLGRHVALKVLPRHMLLDAKAKRRFEREAQAAAKLHHTNIVPVFGVGEQDGMPYYVMQFIQGLGLDDVLEELKKLQPGGAKAGTSADGELRVRGRGRPNWRETQAGRNAARGDVGRGRGPVAPDGRGSTGPSRPGDADERLSDGRSLRRASRPGARDARRPTASSDSFMLSSSSVVLPGRSRDGSKSKGQKPTYWQSVASIGVQVADALEYAHSRGSSTATSSRRTCCSTRRGPSGSPTSAWPRPTTSRT